MSDNFTVTAKAFTISTSPAANRTFMASHYNPMVFGRGEVSGSHIILLKGDLLWLNGQC
jgi:hypothetical protein